VSAEAHGFSRAVVVVPAHNESTLLAACLRSVLTAALCLPIPVQVVTVLDSCDDGSDELAGQFGDDVAFVAVDARNVGAARGAGFTYAESLGGAHDSRTWYATTDADSRVGPDWLLRQLAAEADMVLGVVHVPQLRSHSPELADQFDEAYRTGLDTDTDTDGPEHEHIHGANLGCRADAYWRVGGFAALETGEDVDLVERFEEHGYLIHRDAGLSVATSDRKVGRAPDGFADDLSGMSREAFAMAVGEP